MYKDLYHPAVKKDLKKIDRNARDDIKETWIPKLYCKTVERPPRNYVLHQRSLIVKKIWLPSIITHDKLFYSV